MNGQRDRVLGVAGERFRQYGNEHRAKAHRFQKARLGCSDEVECARLEREEQLSITKAETNEEMVKTINQVLESPTENILERTAEFGRIVHPNGTTPTSQQAQMGVHFEEVAEMCETFTSSDPAIQAAIEAAWAANKALGEALKDNSEKPSISITSRNLFIDAIADQLVTATLSAVQYGMNPVGALNEVNRSNYSKLTDGVMALHPETNKWLKGPNYKPPQLSKFC